ncbi:MAG: DUF6198 family protein [Methanoregula sp.]
MSGAGLIKRYFFLLLGLFLMGLGISLITKSYLGTPPISSVPYVLSTSFPVTFGEFTIMIGLLFFIAEVLVVGKNFPRHQYLQVFVGMFLGIFVDVGMLISASVHPDFYAGQVIWLVLGCVVLALGIYLQVSANVIMNPGEGVVKAIAEKMAVQFGIIKIVFDTSLVFCAVLISFILSGTVTGVREGTIISMFLVGYVTILLSGIFRIFHFEQWLAD